MSETAAQSAGPDQHVPQPDDRRGANKQQWWLNGDAREKRFNQQQTARAQMQATRAEQIKAGTWGGSKYAPIPVWMYLIHDPNWKSNTGVFDGLTIKQRIVYEAAKHRKYRATGEEPTYAFSQSDIATDTGFSVDEIRTALKSLRDKWMIEPVSLRRRGDNKGSREKSRYRIPSYNEVIALRQADPNIFTRGCDILIRNRRNMAPATPQEAAKWGARLEVPAEPAVPAVDVPAASPAPPPAQAPPAPPEPQPAVVADDGMLDRLYAVVWKYVPGDDRAPQVIQLMQTEAAEKGGTLDESDMVLILGSIAKNALRKDGSSKMQHAGYLLEAIPGKVRVFLNDRNQRRVAAERREREEARKAEAAIAERREWIRNLIVNGPDEDRDYFRSDPLYKEVEAELQNAGGGGGGGSG